MLGKPVKIWESGTISADAYSNKWHVKHGTHWSIHIITTGTLSGPIELWRSNVPEPNEANDDDWVEVTDTSEWSPPDPAGSTLNAMVEIGNSSAYHYRLKYDDTSGSGTITAWVFGKSNRS